MLKAYSWWNYKVPPMLAIAFYALYRAPELPGVSEALIAFSLYMIAVTGIAGFGHVFLDAFDVEEDRLGGKPNLWASMSPAGRIFLLAALLGASVLPWIFLRTTTAGLVLIGAEFLFFALYAVPPLRLKTRGFAGILMDAGYAHVLPLLWTWIPFTLLAHGPLSSGFMVVLAAWSALVGMRHLIQHQAFEAVKDAAAGTRTFAVRYGASRSLELVVRVLIPLEVVAFVVMMISMRETLPWLPALFSAYLCFEFYRFRVLWQQEINLFRPVAAADRATIVGTLILSQFYELWLPVILLAALSVRSPSYLIVMVIYLLLFRNGPGQFLRRDLPLLRSRKSAFAKETQAEISRITRPVPTDA